MDYILVPEFEKNVAQKVDSKYGVAVNSATSALHIACLALNLKPEEYVWTSPISFVASSNCALYCEAKIDFVDINSNTTYDLGSGGGLPGLVIAIIIKK